MAVSCDTGRPGHFADFASFILEGIPAVIVGVLIWFFLPDYPETAKFFSQEEKDFCNTRMGPFAPKGESWASPERRSG